jgi:uncharacterized coiled-coil protein SlyX
MNRNLWCIILVALSAPGCSIFQHSNDSETRARHHMLLGDSLEVSSDFAGAVLEYRIVAELYPHTSFYPAAIRKAAVLTLHPNNPSANDSVARYWFAEYLRIVPPSQGRSLAETIVHLLDRIQSLHMATADQDSSIDSLATVVRKQTAELSSRSKQIGTLEAELKQAYEELRKLREVDVRISRGREEK